MAAVGPGHPRAAPTPRAATTSTRGQNNLRRWVRLGRPRPAVPKPDVGAELGAESLHDDGVRLGATVLQRFRRRRLGKHQHHAITYTHSCTFLVNDEALSSLHCAKCSSNDNALC